MRPLIIFVHIPKTAGEVFKRSLEASLPRHSFVRTSFSYFEPFFNLKTRQMDFFQGKEHFVDYIRSLTKEQVEQIRCIGGHDSYYGIHELFPDAEPRYVTFLREPIARTVSLYNFERMSWETYSKKSGDLSVFAFNFLKRMREDFLIDGRPPSFEEWLIKIYDKTIPFYSSMTGFLKHLGFIGDGEKESDLLRKFYFVGITEQYDEDAAYLFRELGVKKRSSDRNASTPYVSANTLPKGVIDKIVELNRADLDLYESAVLENRRFNKMDSTERYAPWSDDLCTGYEHIHRYALAQAYVKNKRVLDLACGEGYGSFLLSETAAQVTGIDIDEESIRRAAKVYRKDHLSFRVGSVTALPIQGKSQIDVVVCFETLEHILDQQLFLNEVKRLLTTEGLLIVSTPNKPVYSEGGTMHNPFHLKELDFPDFEKLLRKYFRHLFFYGQKTYASSRIFPLGVPSRETKELLIKKDDAGFQFTREEDPMPRYFIALASDKEINPLWGTSYLSDISRRKGYIKWEAPGETALKRFVKKYLR